VRRRLALTASAAVLVIAGCGHSPSQRPAVARYIKQVDRIEAQLASPLAAITKLGGQLTRRQGVGGGSLSAFVEQGTMSSALDRIGRLRAKLTSLKTPAPAVRLRQLLVQLIDRQVRMAGELQKLVVFLPRFSAVLAPLGADITRLEAVLSQQTAYGAAAVSAVYARKAAALRSFQASLERMLAKLRRLRPPAVSKPDYDAQIRALSGMSANAGKLAGALAGGTPGSVAPILTAFDHAAASAQSASVKKAHAAAVTSYNRQVAQLSQLSQEAQRERLRLANTLR
jgi:hypothetical protein